MMNNVITIVNYIITIIVYYYLIRFAFGFVMSVCSPKDQDWVGVTFGRFEKLLRNLRDKLYRKLSNPKITEVTYHVDDIDEVVDYDDYEQVIKDEDYE